MTDLPDTRPPSPLKVLYNDDPPGTGKSRFVRQRMAASPGLHVYCAPTLDLLEEAGRDIREFAAEAGRRDILVIPITSSAGAGRGSVASEIAAAPNTYGNQAHVVLLVTHEGLMSADLGGFSGWSLVLDEAMSTVTTGTFRAKALWRWLQQHYRLDVIADGSAEGGGERWSEVTCSGDAVTLSDLMGDTHLRGLIEFHRLATAQGRRLHADLANWEELADGRELSWWSFWPIASASAFSEVIAIANNYTQSLSAQMEAAWEGTDANVLYERLALAPALPRVARAVTIHFFAEDPASTAVWATAEGKASLLRIADWLKGNAPQDPSQFLWSGNDVVRETLRGAALGGTEARPVQPGINAYRGIAWVAMIFSAKMLARERRALRLFQLDRSEVREAREFEALAQFTLRGSLRDPHSSAHARLCVYDRAQAEWLSAFLTKHRFAHPVSIEFENVGVVSRAIPRTPMAPEVAAARKTAKAAERQRRKRERDRKARGDER